MKMRYGMILAMMAVGTMASAQTQKQRDCGYQAAVVAQIQQARLDRVAERQVPSHVAERATWPENYNGAIPIMTPWVYEMKMRDVRTQDLSAAWKEMCLQQ